MAETASQIRSRFLRFFAARGHQVVPSSSLIPAQDPTLLFANAGMNQFKDLFLGRETRSYARAATSQKCMRVSGKHNDLEQVGRTPRHHTFFEMLGNFSFGDYFKKDAIAFAWDLLTGPGEYALPKDSLFITVFRDDDEAYALWRDGIGVPAARISRLDEKDNFWSMGDTGPCGPCSEIHVDRGRGESRCSQPSCGPGCDCGRFMEIWNLVFMQFDRGADGVLHPLAKTGVDTGMGLERITAVLQGVESNYQTDLFAPIVAAAARLAGEAGAGRPEGADDGRRVALQVIADHVRAMTFLISDGVTPGNDGRGYVLRRIMRRAIRFGRLLGLERPFLCDLSDTVVEVMEGAYPELVAHRSNVAATARREEERFADTLALGLQKVEALAATLRRDGRNVIPGPEAFRLYDTFGVPPDLIRDVAQGWSMTVDDAGFEREMEEQRARSRRGMKETPAHVTGALAGLQDAKVDFRGYGETALEEARVVALVRGTSTVESLAAGEEGGVVLDRTPFYAESGGQVGDTGFLTAGAGVAQVLDTRAPVRGLIVHAVRVREGRLVVGERVRAEVDRARRLAVTRGHDATHLVHAALRDLVGTHVKQAGSLVEADRLRFDFSHYAALSEETLRQIEDMVNDVVRQDLPITTAVLPLDEALRRGALAFFGDKYGDTVRVVEVPGFSLELCGGTHAASTGSIGLIRLTQERGVAAGTRRVEALTGEGALREAREERRVLSHVQSALHVERDTVTDVLVRVLEQNRALQREIEKLKVAAAAATPAEKPAGELQEIGGVRVLVPRVQTGLDKSAVRALVDKTRERLPSGVIVQWALQDDRVNVTTSVSKDLIPPLHAGDIVKALAPLVDGRGGGRADMAEAGGRKVGDVEEVRTRSIEIVATIVREARAGR
ncbi:MAG TPA: alanine--tRNA ligase [Patescibacteria group bacterium]|nr:alanine--tRNA ligase [Patescibacteria group bacterium]